MFLEFQYLEGITFQKGYGLVTEGVWRYVSLFVCSSITFLVKGRRVCWKRSTGHKEQKVINDFSSGKDLQIAAKSRSKSLARKAINSVGLGAYKKKRKTRN
ncbi:hypothetical protein CEXT_56451 [Caerostris extrusa]|uniref:Uncharacterized protein n=1 Tax=Caerostris extrusa TaxID=172846 RepID=A0AAV4T525_CAEEX|nr:hypothetical protein CEXT_56451 [Caerostris extrusa]